MWNSHAARLLGVVCGLGLPGCITNRVDLVENGTVRTEQTVPKSLLMFAPRVWQDDGEVTVYGRVRRSQAGSGIIRGHVDVTVIGPDGMVLQTVSARHSPGDIPLRQSPGSSFSAKLPGVPPQGSTVRVTYHSVAKHE